MKIALTKLTNKNLGTLALRFINISKKPEHAFIHTDRLLAKLEEAYTLYEQVVLKKTYSGLGDDLEAADLVRDKAFAQLRDFVRAAANMDGHIYQPHAQLLLAEVYALIGDGTNQLTYAEQTMIMEQFLIKMDEAPRQAAITGMAATDQYNAIKDAQAAFEDMYHSQAHANADLRAIPTASSLRTKVEDTVRAYAGMLTSYKDEPNYDKLYLELNEVVKSAERGELGGGGDDDTPPNP